MKPYIPVLSRSLRSWTLHVPALVAALALGGCDTDKLLEPEPSDVIPPEALDSPVGLATFRNAGLGDFQVAYSGSSTLEGVVNYGGLLADELESTDTFPTRDDMDARRIRDDNSNNLAVFSSLARARVSAERGTAQFAKLQQDATTGGRATATDTLNFFGQRAELFNLAGYTYVFFAENYCEGVAFAEVDESGNIIPAAPINRDQTLLRALARFDSAQALAGRARPTTANPAGVINQTQERLARLGKARAYMHRATSRTSAFMDSALAVLGGQAETLVPTSFEYRIFHSENAGRQNNGVDQFVFRQLRWRVGNRQGGTGLPFRDAYVPGVDVRTANVANGIGFDGRAHFRTLKYPARNSSVVLGGGVEARLIQAEVALNKGDITTFLAKLNGLRANVALNQCPERAAPPCVNPSAALAPLADPGTDDGRVNLLFQERAYWLHLTAQRLGDLRRLIRQYGRTPDAVFPSNLSTRRYELGTGNYGTDVSFPIPEQERNNPLFPQAGATCDNSAA